MSETFSLLSNLAGKRITDNQRLGEACEVLDELPCSDLLSLLTVATQTRSKSVTTREIIDGNRFHTPSAISQKDFHWLEGIIFDSATDIDFLELSPIQPFGINQVLAGTNQKNVISALRRSEVNADATTALFRIALQQYLQNGPKAQSIRLGSNLRASRAQLFDADTKFLPHFKVFAEVTVGRQTSSYGTDELDSIVDHLATEVSIIDEVAAADRSNIRELHISLGNMALLCDLVEQGRVDIIEARRNTTNPQYSLMEANGLDLPEYVLFDVPNLGKEIAALGFKKGVKVTERLHERIQKHFPDLLPRIKLHLGRVAGTGYYKHVCYKLDATSKDGINVPVADGGSTDWAVKVTDNKQIYNVTSGIGTELVCQYLINEL